MIYEKRNHLSDLKITYVYHDQTYNLDNGTEVDTLLSNDSGVAFIVRTKEGTIYHAGDLNDWYWDGELKAATRDLLLHIVQRSGKLRVCILMLHLFP